MLFARMLENISTRYNADSPLEDGDSRISSDPFFNDDLRGD